MVGIRDNAVLGRGGDGEVATTLRGQYIPAEDFQQGHTVEAGVSPTSGVLASFYTERVWTRQM